jgi:predicted dehydrogenase
MRTPLKTLVVGLGHMGVHHARAYHHNPGFEVVGLMSRSIRNAALPDELTACPRFTDFDQALSELKPEVVSINSWPDTHADYAIKAMEAGAHVFLEKPIATTIEDAERVVAAAVKHKRKLLLGYILRVHPSWIKFIEIGRSLGKPLVMRLNLNQQSSEATWTWHRNLLQSITPLVDVGVHYIDVMCQLTGAKPVSVHGIAARLWDEGSRDNYGHLHVTFDDGSVGWFESSWGPMMSETAYFVKDVVGPKGAVSMIPATAGSGDKSAFAPSADIERHARTDTIRIHRADVDTATRAFIAPDEFLSMDDEPNLQGLCDREQALFLRAIIEDLDLTDSMAAAVNSLRVVLAAEESIRTGQVVTLPA